MKKSLILIIAFLLLAFGSAQFALADKPTKFDGQGIEVGWIPSPPADCATIQSGLITDSLNNVITAGFDQFGYNYQAHMFNGTYDSSDRVLDGKYWGQTGDFVDDKLMMKWSDSWIANVDCNNDGKLDRGLVNGIVGGISLGWLTNHVEGDYTDTNGVQNYTDFVKIVWTGPGSPLWGQYTIIEEVLNDPASGYSGLLSKIGAPGFGLNSHWTVLQ
jgi:hypothetical protein